jgi:hypothetical protein
MRRTAVALGFLLAVGAGMAFVQSPARAASVEDKVRIAAPFHEACQVRSISCGQTVSGTISDADCRFLDNSYVEYWQFSGQQGQQVQIDMASSEVDPYLLLYSSGHVETPRIVDDDSGPGLDARIVYTLNQTRTWIIGANTRFANDFGNYSLTLACSGGGAPGPVCTGSSAPTAVAQTLPAERASSRYAVRDVISVDAFTAAPLDLSVVVAEDEADARQGLPPRYAIPQRVAITPTDNGTWEQLPDGLMLWRLRIVGHEGTTSLNLGFSRFRLPAHAQLLLYSADGTHSLRPFTAADNEVHGQLWTPALVTDELILELTVPAAERDAVELEVSSVNQGYRGFGTLPLKSGACNMDVACLGAGDTWREEMRAVAVISTGGSRFCTGSLLNNTANDRKMYFITANHCNITASNAPSLVAYWNYQSSHCRSPGGAASGLPGDGQLTQFHTGAILRASYSPSDFTLVELDDPSVAAYDHYWAGWDRSSGDFACSDANACASIHHPRGEEKRITYSTSATRTTSNAGTVSPGDGTHIWAHWATDPPGSSTVPAVTEPGSSGSPLYNAAGRFIGQLHGGPSSCGASGDGLSDYYGRFSVSWAGGGTGGTRLSSWLDPGNTAAPTLAGLDCNRGGGGAGGACVADGDTLCLSNDRFKVEATFATTAPAAAASGKDSGTAQVVELTSDTGYGWFFAPENVEFVLKIINACAFNNRFWVFAGGLTDVRVDVTVTDTRSGASKTYINPLGQKWVTITDTNAFATCP